METDARKADESVCRYRKERHFDKPPEAIWPFVANTARLNELSGSPRYQVEEHADAQGRIHRLASVRAGPLRLRWEEGYGEWQENRRLSRHATSSTARSAVPILPSNSNRRTPAAAYLFRGDRVCRRAGMADQMSGQISAKRDKRLAVIERLIAEGDTPTRSRLQRARGGKAGGPPPSRRADRRARSRSGEPRPGAEARRLSAARAGGGAARHPPAGAWRERGTRRRRTPWSCSSRRNASAFWPWGGICFARAAAAPSRASSICTNCREARIARRATSTIGAISPATSN